MASGVWLATSEQASGEPTGADLLAPRVDPAVHIRHTVRPTASAKGVRGDDQERGADAALAVARVKSAERTVGDIVDRACEVLAPATLERAAPKTRSGAARHVVDPAHGSPEIASSAR